MITVKNRDKLTSRLFQRIINVTGLGMLMGRTGDIFHPNLLSKLPKLFTSTIV